MLKILNKKEEWDKLKNSNAPFIILKQSNTCYFSSKAKERVMTVIDQIPYDIYEIVVQENKEISDDIKELYEIRHLPSQFIVVEDGKPIMHLNHRYIQPEAILEFFDKK